jgi:predicted O-linked N-acetylglucosamine transferase (SPINDLY family)
MKQKKHHEPSTGQGLGAPAQREIRDKLQQVTVLLQAQRLAQADYLCQELLKKYPQAAQAWYFRGAIAHQAKKPMDAIAHLRQALALAPAQAPYWQALAAVQMAVGDGAGAVQSHTQAVQTNPQDSKAHFHLAMALGTVGDGLLAIQAYSRVLALEPRHWTATFNRGLLHQKRNDNAAAVEDFTQVLQLRPSETSTYYSLGLSLRRLERYDEALDAFQKVLDADPGHADAYNSCGSTLAAMGQYQAAIDLYEKALQINPLLVEAYLNMGLALYDLKRYEEALDCYQKVLGFGGAPADVYYHMANALNELRRHAQAIGCYEQALALGYDTSEIRLNQAIAYSHHGDKQKAVQLLREFAADQPDHVEAHIALSDGYRQLNQHALAVEFADRALQLRPGIVSALNLRGLALYDMGLYDQALASFDAALQGNESFATGQFHRGHALTAMKRYQEAVDSYAAVLKVEPEYPYALGYLMHTQLQLCQWNGYAQNVQRLRQMVREELPADTPFAFLSVGATAVEQLACATYLAKHMLSEKAPVWTGERYGHARIRVAYVSADFGEHPTSYLMAGLFEQHDRQHVEVYGIGLLPAQDSPTGHAVKAAFDHYIDVSHMSDLEVAQWLRAHEIDIAVDLMGYTKNNRAGIFMHRAAPVQVNYLGYPGSMGGACMDYILADEVLIPTERRHGYSENVVYLPGCFQVNDNLRAATEQRPARADYGLPRDGVVFCSFNGSHKLNPEFFAIWMRLLQQVPGSVLWLVDPGAVAIENLRRYAAGHGVDPDRLVWAPKRPYAEHLARLSLADLFLDSLPFGAGATASDALFAGLPVLTCAGDAFSGRMAASLLTALGLADPLVTHDVAAYEARALALARSPDQLRAVRGQLAQARFTSSLFDTAGFCRHLEQAYRQMLLRAEAGLPPQDFKVAP